MAKNLLRPEILKVSRKNNQVSIDGILHGIQFRDEQTNQWICFVPSIDISGYGDSIEAAHEMMNFAKDEFMSTLIKRPMKEIHAELFRLGWSKQKIATKIFRPNFKVEDRASEEGIKDFKVIDTSFAA